MEQFFSPNSGEEQKKDLYQKRNTFSPNSIADLRLDAHQSQIVKLLGGDADVDHTQIIGGIQSNYWGIYPPPILLGLRHPWSDVLK